MVVTRAFRRDHLMRSRTLGFESRVRLDRTHCRQGKGVGEGEGEGEGDGEGEGEGEGEDD